MKKLFYSGELPEHAKSYISMGVTDLVEILCIDNEYAFDHPAVTAGILSFFSEYAVMRTDIMLSDNHGEEGGYITYVQIISGTSMTVLDRVVATVSVVTDDNGCMQSPTFQFIDK